MAKNYAIGRHTALWFNQGQEGKQGYYTVSITKKYTDKAGIQQESKISLFADEALRVLSELEQAKRILLFPREIVVQQQPDISAGPVNNIDSGDDLPF